MSEKEGPGSDGTPGPLRRYIETRDKRVGKASWNQTAISDLWAKFIEFRTIRVGGRATAGAGNLDPSWVEFTAWGEVVLKAQKLGYNITITNTMPSTRGGSQGYWNENDYTIEGGTK